MDGQHFTLSAAGVEAVLDLETGHLASFVVEREGRRFAPFHRAPWADDEVVDESLPPHLKHLSIDFFCAPFGASDVEAAPAHGWSANAAWTVAEHSVFPGGASATFHLSRKILSARVVKTLTVRDGHPFLYQSHRFEGGTSALPVAYHAMVDLPTGGVLSFSPKLRAETSHPLEPDPAMGRSVLAYPATSTDLCAFPNEGGGTTDLCLYPLAKKHVELVMLIEDSRNTLGWAIAARPRTQDLAIVLKAPSILPSTLLWYSNGGRDYAPWNGRHVGVLGIEEACTHFGDGHAVSVKPNALSNSGTPTAFDTATSEEVRSVIGTFGLEADHTFRSISVADGNLVLVGHHGGTIVVPFDTTYLAQ